MLRGQELQSDAATKNTVDNAIHSWPFFSDQRKPIDRLRR